MNMNRNQWFKFAFAFLSISILFIGLSLFQSRAANMIFTIDMGVVGSNLYNALIVKGAIYGSLGLICFALGLTFFSCGYSEKKH